MIVTHSSGAMWKGNGPIVMDAAQTRAAAIPDERLLIPADGETLEL